MRTAKFFLRTFDFFPLLIVLHASFNFNVVFSIDEDSDLVFTEEESNALTQFRPMVIDSLPETFMHTDFYLIRWLRMSNLNLEEAQRLILETVRWREANNMTEILTESWADLEQDYHILFYGKDKTGRPIACIDLGDWNLRSAIIHGNTRRVIRYLTYSLEKGMHILFQVMEEQQKQLEEFPVEDKNASRITRGLVLVDLENFGTTTHLCPTCLSILSEWIRTMEAHYPRCLNRIVVINAPRISSIAMNVLRPFMSSGTKGTMKVFGQNKEKWMTFLDERIERDQRTVRYGGDIDDEYSYGNKATIANKTIIIDKHARS